MRRSRATKEMDDQSIATAHTNDTPFPGSRGQGGSKGGGGGGKSKKHGKGKGLPEIKSPRSPRSDADRSPRGMRASRDDDDASHASSITQAADKGGAPPARGVDIGMMAQREVQKQFQLAERMNLERNHREAAIQKDAADLAQLDEQIGYIRRERLDRLDADLKHRKEMYATVSHEFEAAMKRLHDLSSLQANTVHKSMNKASRVTRNFISNELTATRGYSMRNVRKKRFQPPTQLAPLPKFSPVVPG